MIHDICDAYAAHEEGLGEGNYPIDAAPLSHPWCTCLYYVDTHKTLEQIGQELRGWLDGEENERLDTLYWKSETRNILDIYEINGKKSLFADVTDKYISEATPSSGKITVLDGYKMRTHQEEIKVAQWILETFGGDIVLLPESTIPGEQTSDYFWNGEAWELKTISSIKAAEAAIRKGLHQMGGKNGGIILDCSFQLRGLMELIDSIDRRMRGGFLQSTDIMIKHNSQIVRILRYKK